MNNKEKAIKLYKESQSIRNTAGESYLQKTRKIEVKNNDLNKLRYNTDKKAIISPIYNYNKEIISINRIYIDNNFNKIENKVLGSNSTGFTPFGKLPTDTKQVIICEGLETALAIRSGIDIPVISSISATNLSKIPLEKLFSNSTIVHFFADDDKSETGLNESKKAINRLVQLGYKCRLHLPMINRQNHQKSIDFLDQYNKLGVNSIIESFAQFEEFPKEILPIRSNFKKIKNLTPDMVPDFLWDWSNSNAKNLNIPPELLAGPFICSVSGFLGTNFSICPKEKDLSYVVTPNLWGIVVAPPSFKKSPALKKVEKFFGNAQKKHLQKNLMVINNNKEKILLLKTNIKISKKELSDRSIDQERRKELIHQIITLEDELKEVTPSSLERILGTTTIEKVCELSTTNKQGFLMVIDEIMSLFQKFRQKGHEADKQFYLSSWSGNQTYREATISRGTNEVDPLCISILGTTQPVKIASVVNQMRKDDHDGFIQRFQVLIYPDNNFKQKFTDEYHVEKYDFPLQKIADRLFDMSDQATCQYKLCKESYILYRKYFNQLEETIASTKCEYFSAHLAKFYSLTASLALVFQVMQEILDEKGFSSTITKPSMEMAIKWTDYLKLNAEKLYDPNYSFPAFVGKSLAEKIASGLISSGDSTRDIYIKGWSNLSDSKSVEAAAKYLEKHNWLTLDSVKASAGGRPSQKLIFDPRLIDFLENSIWEE